MTGPTLTGLDLARDQLAEARRYTHTKPETAARLIDLAIGDLYAAIPQIDDKFRIANVRRGLIAWIRCGNQVSRICRNLIVGQHCMAAAPDVTDAYITGALWELGDLASQLRKADEAEGRDRELMDGYGPRIEAADEGRDA